MKKFTLLAGFLVHVCVLQAQELSGLIAKYSFNDGSVVDNVGSHDLVLNTGVFTATDRFGNIFHAVQLDGTSGYLNTNNPFFYPGNSFTLSMWFKSESVTQSAQTFFNTSPHEQISVGYNWFGNNTFDIATNDGTSWNICSNAANGLDTFSVSSVNALNWNHFTMTYDGTTWNSYINAVLVNTCNGGTPASSVSDLYFGAISVGPQSFFSGSLDDIRVFDRALTPQEITQLFNEIDPATASISDLSAVILSIYPNPAKDKLTIESSQSTTLRLINVQGQQLQTIEVDEKTIVDVSSLQSGVYMLIGEGSNPIRFIKE